MMANKILVTGGTGLVGRYLQEILPEAIYVSSKDYNLLDTIVVEHMYEDINPDIVVHLAAYVGGITENIKFPVEFFERNLLMNTFMLRAAYQYKVPRFISMLSSCAYPDVVDQYPITEEMLHLGPPAKTNLPYGYAKRAMAVQIEAYNTQYNTRYNYLMPCNLYGKYDNFDEGSHFVAALLKKIYMADSFITLFGTGAPLRQFMLASDLAEIIKLTIENDITESFNVAPNFNYSIKEMAEIAVQMSGKDLEIIFDPAFPDGQYRKDIDSFKLLKLFPDFKFTPFEEGIKIIYEEIQND